MIPVDIDAVAAEERFFTYLDVARVAALTCLGKYRQLRGEFSDVYQECLISLMESARVFVPSPGADFRPFAMERAKWRVIAALHERRSAGAVSLDDVAGQRDGEHYTEADKIEERLAVTDTNNCYATYRELSTLGAAADIILSGGAGLTDRERKVLEFLYLRGLSMARIATRLKTHPSKISRNARDGINKVCAALGLKMHPLLPGNKGFKIDNGALLADVRKVFGDDEFMSYYEILKRLRRISPWREMSRGYGIRQNVLEAALKTFGIRSRRISDKSVANELHLTRRSYVFFREDVFRGSRA